MQSRAYTHTNCALLCCGQLKGTTVSTSIDKVFFYSHVFVFANLISNPTFIYNCLKTPFFKPILDLEPSKLPIICKSPLKVMLDAWILSQSNNFWTIKFTFSSVTFNCANSVWCAINTTKNKKDFIFKIDLKINALQTYNPQVNVKLHG